VEEVKVYDHLGQRVIVLPQGYELDTETVYLLRDGITLLVIPANDAGDALVQGRRRDILTDPERVARWRVLTEPHLTDAERYIEPHEPTEE
jgi:hypothetical protein